MGGVLSCTGGKRLPDVMINLDSTDFASDDEREIYNNFKDAIKDSDSLVTAFSNYKDQDALVKKALVHNTPENTSAALAAVEPNIRLCAQVCEFSDTLADHLIKLLNFVIGKEEYSVTVLERYSHITQAIIEIFTLMLRFDEIKLGLFKLLGDISFYRRTIKNPEAIQDRTQSVMPLFYGQPAPFLERIAGTVRNIYDKTPQYPKALEALGSFTDILTSILTNDKPNQQTIDKCMKGIAGSVLILDNILPTGVFCEHSPALIAQAMQAFCRPEYKVTGLYNAVKYNSKHLADATTLPSVRDLFK